MPGARREEGPGAQRLWETWYTQPANIASVRPCPALLFQKSAVIATLTSVKGRERKVRVHTSWELYPAPQLCSVVSFSWLLALLFFPFLVLSSLPFLFHFPSFFFPFPSIPLPICGSFIYAADSSYFVVSRADRRTSQTLGNDNLVFVSCSELRTLSLEFIY